MGIHGNEVADFLTKKGSSLGEGSTNELLTPQVKQKCGINDYFRTIKSSAGVSKSSIVTSIKRPGYPLVEVF